MLTCHCLGPSALLPCMLVGLADITARNHSFKHFVYFVKEFDLVEDSESEPRLARLIHEKASTGIGWSQWRT